MYRRGRMPQGHRSRDRYRNLPGHHRPSNGHSRFHREPYRRDARMECRNEFWDTRYNAHRHRDRIVEFGEVKDRRDKGMGKIPEISPAGKNNVSSKMTVTVGRNVDQKLPKSHDPVPVSTSVVSSTSCCGSNSLLSPTYLLTIPLPQELNAKEDNSQSKNKTNTELKPPKDMNSTVLNSNQLSQKNSVPVFVPNYLPPNPFNNNKTMPSQPSGKDPYQHIVHHMADSVVQGLNTSSILPIPSDRPASNNQSGFNSSLPIPPCTSVHSVNCIQEPQCLQMVDTDLRYNTLGSVPENNRLHQTPIATEVLCQPEELRRIGQPVIYREMQNEVKHMRPPLLGADRPWPLSIFTAPPPPPPNPYPGNTQTQVSYRQIESGMDYLQNQNLKPDIPYYVGVKNQQASQNQQGSEFKLKDSYNHVDRSKHMSLTDSHPRMGFNVQTVSANRQDCYRASQQPIEACGTFMTNGTRSNDHRDVNKCRDSNLFKNRHQEKMWGHRPDNMPNVHTSCVSTNFHGPSQYSPKEPSVQNWERNKTGYGNHRPQPNTVVTRSYSQDMLDRRHSICSGSKGMLGEFESDRYGNSGVGFHPTPELPYRSNARFEHGDLRPAPPVPYIVRDRSYPCRNNNRGRPFSYRDAGSVDRSFRRDWRNDHHPGYKPYRRESRRDTDQTCVEKNYRKETRHNIDVNLDRNRPSRSNYRYDRDIYPPSISDSHNSLPKHDKSDQNQITPTADTGFMSFSPVSSIGDDEIFSIDFSTPIPQMTYTDHCDPLMNPVMTKKTSLINKTDICGKSMKNENDYFEMKQESAIVGTDKHDEKQDSSLIVKCKIENDRVHTKWNKEFSVTKTLDKFRNNDQTSSIYNSQPEPELIIDLAEKEKMRHVSSTETNEDKQDTHTENNQQVNCTASSTGIKCIQSSKTKYKPTAVEGKCPERQDSSKIVHKFSKKSRSDQDEAALQCFEKYKGTSKAGINKNNKPLIEFESRDYYVNITNSVEEKKLSEKTGHSLDTVKVLPPFKKAYSNSLKEMMHSSIKEVIKPHPKLRHKQPFCSLIANAPSNPYDVERKSLQDVKTVKVDKYKKENVKKPKQALAQNSKGEVVKKTDHDQTNKKLVKKLAVVLKNCKQKLSNEGTMTIHAGDKNKTLCSKISSQNNGSDLKTKFDSARRKESLSKNVQTVKARGKYVLSTPNTYEVMKPGRSRKYDKSCDGQTDTLQKACLTAKKDLLYRSLVLQLLSRDNTKPLAEKKPEGKRVSGITKDHVQKQLQNFVQPNKRENTKNTCEKIVKKERKHDSFERVIRTNNKDKCGKSKEADLLDTPCPYYKPRKTDFDLMHICVNEHLASMSSENCMDVKPTFDKNNTTSLADSLLTDLKVASTGNDVHDTGPDEEYIDVCSLDVGESDDLTENEKEHTDAKDQVNKVAECRETVNIGMDTSPQDNMKFVNDVHNKYLGKTCTNKDKLLLDESTEMKDSMPALITAQSDNDYKVTTAPQEPPILDPSFTDTFLVDPQYGCMTSDNIMCTTAGNYSPTLEDFHQYRQNQMMRVQADKQNAAHTTCEHQEQQSCMTMSDLTTDYYINTDSCSDIKDTTSYQIQWPLHENVEEIYLAVPMDIYENENTTYNVLNEPENRINDAKTTSNTVCQNSGLFEQAFVDFENTKEEERAMLAKTSDITREADVDRRDTTEPNVLISVDTRIESGTLEKDSNAESLPIKPSAIFIVNQNPTEIDAYVSAKSEQVATMRVDTNPKVINESTEVEQGVTMVIDQNSTEMDESARVKESTTIILDLNPTDMGKGMALEERADSDTGEGKGDQDIERDIVNTGHEDPTRLSCTLQKPGRPTEVLVKQNSTAWQIKRRPQTRSRSKANQGLVEQMDEAPTIPVSESDAIRSAMVGKATDGSELCEIMLPQTLPATQCYTITCDQQDDMDNRQS